MHFQREAANKHNMTITIVDEAIQILNKVGPHLADKVVVQAVTAVGKTLDPDQNKEFLADFEQPLALENDAANGDMKCSSTGMLAAVTVGASLKLQRWFQKVDDTQTAGSKLGKGLSKCYYWLGMAVVATAAWISYQDDWLVQALSIPASGIQTLVSTIVSDMSSVSASMGGGAYGLALYFGAEAGTACFVYLLDEFEQKDKKFGKIICDWRLAAAACVVAGLLGVTLLRRNEFNAIKAFLEFGSLAVQGSFETAKFLSTMVTGSASLKLAICKYAMFHAIVLDRDPVSDVIGIAKTTYKTGKSIANRVHDASVNVAKGEDTPFTQVVESALKTSLQKGDRVLTHYHVVVGEGEYAFDAKSKDAMLALIEEVVQGKNPAVCVGLANGRYQYVPTYFVTEVFTVRDDGDEDEDDDGEEDEDRYYEGEYESGGNAAADAEEYLGIRPNIGVTITDPNA